MLENKKPIVLGLYGGPGVGKSTLASRLFAELKEMGLSVEVAPEFAKDLVWEESFGVLSDQLYVFATQQHRIFRLAKSVDIIITDSPLIFSIVYGPKMSDHFHKLVLEEFDRYPRFDIFVERVYAYQQEGRNENLEQAIAVDNRIKDLFEVYGYEFDVSIPSDKQYTPLIIQKLMDKINS